MAPQTYRRSDSVSPSLKIFHNLMPRKINEILLVSSRYDAFIMEEDGRLAGRIVHEYRGLNLSRPPRLTWVSTAKDALAALEKSRFDLVVTMPRLDDMAPFDFVDTIKARYPSLPVFLLTHTTSPILREFETSNTSKFDGTFVWHGNTDLLLALIKHVEDRLNVANDTREADVRVIILVEDSPLYASSILPLLYREVVLQTQRVMEESVNEEHRLLRMRARPKILLAETFEEAQSLYHQYRPFIISVISDIRFPRGGRIDTSAGVALLTMIKENSPDIALLNLSSDDVYRDSVLAIPAAFINKNSPFLHSEIRNFFMEYLGFGDFVFRTPDGVEVGRASNLKNMEQMLPDLPNDSVLFHASRNDFSIWFMARSEIELASELRPLTISDFSGPDDIKAFLTTCLQKQRKSRQRGIVTDFSIGGNDPDYDFIKFGEGSMGGKARGLAFFSTLLMNETSLQKEFGNVDMLIPKTVVITTEAFDAFMAENELKQLSFETLTDKRIQEIFLSSSLPDDLTHILEVFLSHATYPLAVRSSSLMEDSQSQPFAGIYKTYMLSNAHADMEKRLAALARAIKLVFASTYLEASRSFSESTFHRAEEEKMAVIIQQIIGSRQGDFFYPALSGVVHSYNFYPVSPMRSGEGVAHIALGLGKTVMDGGTSLRFSPKHPEFLPGFSTIEEILENSQRSFYAIRLSDPKERIDVEDDASLVRLEIDEATSHFPLSLLCGTYIHEEQRIRPSLRPNGTPVLTFGNVLKGKSFPFPQVLTRILDLGRKGMGGPVEIEFAVDLKKRGAVFAILQIRPLVLDRYQRRVEISQTDLNTASCVSSMALGNGWLDDIVDIVYVKPESFDPGKTIAIAEEISRVNHQLKIGDKRYLLIGPGRWGSADPWLGVPVKWKDISSVKVIVEIDSEKLKATPSQGAHFFHNITSMGISYLTVQHGHDSHLDWAWLTSLPVVTEHTYVKHVASPVPLLIKVDGKKSSAVIIPKAG